MRTLARELFIKSRIKTTEEKAKESSRFAEKIITRAKKGDLSAVRHLSGLFEKKLVKKIIEEIAPKYKERNGGCIRIIKMGPRKSDGAKMAIIELV